MNRLTLPIIPISPFDCSFFSALHNKHKDRNGEIRAKKIGFTALLLYFLEKVWVRVHCAVTGIRGWVCNSGIIYSRDAHKYSSFFFSFSFGIYVKRIIIVKWLPWESSRRSDLYSNDDACITSTSDFSYTFPFQLLFEKETISHILSRLIRPIYSWM